MWVSKTGTSHGPPGWVVTESFLEFLKELFPCVDGACAPLDLGIFAFLPQHGYVGKIQHGSVDLVCIAPDPITPEIIFHVP